MSIDPAIEDRRTAVIVAASVFVRFHRENTGRYEWEREAIEISLRRLEEALAAYVGRPDGSEDPAREGTP